MFKVVNYIDDFLICAPDQETCHVFMNIFLQELNRFGFSCNTDKMVNPNTMVKYLGIEIDTVKMTLSLPFDKLENVRELISSFLQKKSATKLELQRLAGNLSHCSTIIRAGKTFSRRVINIIKYFPLNRRTVRLLSEFYADLLWWSAFSQMFNGTGQIIKSCDIDTVIYTDACGKGFGGYIDSHSDYFFGSLENCILSPCAHVENGPVFTDGAFF